MKIIQLQAENFKRLQAVEINPEGNVITIGGKNGSGKSSVLDAIYVALVGLSVAPPKPIRDGEETCNIKLDLGDLVITRKFTVKDGNQFTHSVKVENADGLRYGKPQEVLDALLGEIGFDPFEFVLMKPKEQAETLLRMVPLPVDLDELAELDTSDFAKRRDVNRDVAALKAQVDAIPKEEVPPDLPDRQALVDQLGNAANHNAAIAADRQERESLQLRIETNQRRAAELLAEAKDCEQRAAEGAKALAAKEPLAEPLDTDAIRTQLHEADATLAVAERQRRRTELEQRHATLAAESEKLTAAMMARQTQRDEALTKAKMPIEGLAFALDDKGHPVVQFGGVPFEQASSAEQLRASTAIAMSANPTLRVVRIKDGSLLDDDSMAMLAEMAGDGDFQLWIERVGTGGVGIVMEDGAIAGEPAKPKAEAKPKAAKAEPAKAAPEKLL